MHTFVELASGRMKSAPNLDGMIITTPTATIKGDEDTQLRKGDVIRLDGSIWRDGKLFPAQYGE